jgi:hypothetical protein
MISFSPSPLHVKNPARPPHGVRREMEAKPPQERSATVSRVSYFGGLLVGGAVLAIGFFLLSRFEAGGWTIPLEMAVVAVAMLLTTGIWRRSAARELDTPIEPKDRT